MLATGLTTEIILVDDGSSDDTRDTLASWGDCQGIRIILQENYQAKGAAVRAGKACIYIVPILFSPRDYADDKKISIKDAFSAAWALSNYRFVD